MFFAFRGITFILLSFYPYTTPILPLYYPFSTILYPLLPFPHLFYPRLTLSHLTSLLILSSYCSQLLPTRSGRHSRDGNQHDIGSQEARYAQFFFPPGISPSSPLSWIFLLSHFLPFSPFSSLFSPIFRRRSDRVTLRSRRTAGSSVSDRILWLSADRRWWHPRVFRYLWCAI